MLQSLFQSVDVVAGAGYFGVSGAVGFALGGSLAVVLQAPCPFLQAYHAEFAAVELGVDVAEQVPDYPVGVAGGVTERVVGAVMCHGVEEEVEAVYDVGAGVFHTFLDFDDWVLSFHDLGTKPRWVRINHSIRNPPRAKLVS